jgi:hypothetical protein
MWQDWTMTRRRDTGGRPRWLKPVVYGAVIAGHAAVFAIAARTSPSPLPPIPTPPFEVSLSARGALRRAPGPQSASGAA